MAAFQPIASDTLTPWNDPVQEPNAVTLTGRDLHDAKRILALLAAASIEPGDASSGPAQPTRLEGPPELAISGRQHEFTARARQALEARRKGIVQFGRAIYDGPTWEILVTLYVAGWQRGPAISSIIKMLGAPPTSVLRWLETLEHRALIERVPDPVDRRAVIIQLSDAGRRALAEYFAEPNVA